MSKYTKNRRRIAELDFSQPRDFIAATGYGNARIRLDTQAVSLQVSSETIRNLGVIKEQ